MKYLEKILILSLLLLLFVPIISKFLPMNGKYQLQGDFTKAEKPNLSKSTWLDGQYQPAYESYLNDHLGLKDFLVRLRNQIDFSVFKNLHAEGVVSGKDGQLFESDYIRAFYGIDFLGDKYIDRKIRKLKFVQQYLKKEKNIDLVLVFEPGKASFFPDKIKKPPPLKSRSNYEAFMEHCDQYEVSYIDFNAYYKKMKDTASYPLYTKYGIHWSQYGMSVIADSLLNYIEKSRNIRMGKANIDSLILSSDPQYTDNDVEKVLNLLKDLKRDELMAYPSYSFAVDSSDYKPMVLFVGDSYYWNIFNTGIPDNLFKNQAFWYFYNQVYPDHYSSPTLVENLNLQEEIEQQEVIFLSVTERFLYKFDWGFIDDLYRLYGIESQLDKTYEFHKYIRKHSEWFNNVLHTAEEKGISLAENIFKNADYSFRMDHPEAYYTFKGKEYYIELIHNDQKWKDHIVTKAEENGISPADQIEKDALWTFQNEHPQWYNQYIKVAESKEQLLTDTVKVQEIRNIANYYYLDFEEVLQIEAEKMSGLKF